MLRAKFKCTNIHNVCASQQDVELTAVQSTENIEDQDFNDATPNGELKMMISNTAAHKFFKLHEDYYLDFTPVEDK